MIKLSSSPNITCKSEHKLIPLTFMVSEKDSRQDSEKQMENGPYLTGTEDKLLITEKESRLMDFIQFTLQEKDPNISTLTT